MSAASAASLPPDLPPTFTYGQARASGLTKHSLYSLRNRGSIERLTHGVYRRRDAPAGDLDLITVATKAPRATLCLATALARHGLTDAIPAAIDIALPRGTRPPAVGAPVQWHRFTPNTFDIGRQTIELDASTDIGLYSAERSIIDAFRMRGTEGHELANEALRRWLRRRGNQPGELLDLARQFPKAATPLRTALEILL